MNLDTLQLAMIASEFDLPEEVFTDTTIKDFRTSDPDVYPRNLRIRFNQAGELAYQLKHHSLCVNSTSFDDKEIWLQKYEEKN